jgi:hypothetical protein
MTTDLDAPGTPPSPVLLDGTIRGMGAGRMAGEATRGAVSGPANPSIAVAVSAARSAAYTMRTIYSLSLTDQCTITFQVTVSGLVRVRTGTSN